MVPRPTVRANAVGRCSPAYGAYVEASIFLNPTIVRAPELQYPNLRWAG